jgi:aminoglycoside 6'-N-acetyltransferase I
MSSDAVEVTLLSAPDVSVLDRVEPDVFDFPVQRAFAEQYLSTPGNLLAVATVSGVVIGMASAIAYVHPDKPRQLFINEVGVAERVQGQGIGTRLINALLEHARTSGCSEAWVATELNNKAARALYSSLGGVEDQEHTVVYTWQLRSEPPGAKGGDP